MISVDADYCPLCGTAVETRDIDGRERAYCPACERVLWRNAVPAAVVAVVDGAEVCCIERGEPPAEGAWSLPGGHLEYDEPLPDGAARELEEETGLAVDPDDLTVVGTGFATGPERNHVGVQFAVEREETSGELDAGDDAADAAFLTPEAYDEREELIQDRETLERALSMD
jgi:ADP-ribose pyrophosphatase YjhB (NUDIX family)